MKRSARAYLLAPVPLLIIVAVLVIGGGGAAGLLLGTFDGGGSSSTSVNLQKGLVGHWKLDGDVKDATPYENHGTPLDSDGSNGDGDTPPQLTTDRKGQGKKAYDFDGSDDYIEINFTDGALGLDRVSTCLWAYADGSVSNEYLFDGQDHRWWIKEDDNAETLKAEVETSNGLFTVTSTNPIPSQEWAFICSAYDGSQLTLYLYNQSGLIEKSTNTNASGNLVSHSGNGRIGDFTGGGYSFAGKIDDVRLYNRGISADEAAALHEQYDASVKVASTQGGLVNQWQMDGDFTDATPYENHGTPTDADASNGDGDTPPQLTTDRKGQGSKAYDFDGSDDYISGISQPSVQTSPNLFTVTGFIKPGNQYSRFITPQSVGIDQWIGYDASSERLEITIAEAADTNQRQRYSTTGSVPLGTWTHWAVIIDDKNIKIYINGRLDSEYNESIDIAGWTNDWVIGQRGNDTYWFLGKMDDFRVYDYALSGQDIRKINDSYSPGIDVSDLQKDLTGNWVFDQDAKDRTPYEHHGTPLDADASNGDGDTPPQLTTDRKGHASKAYQFDGTDDYMALDMSYSAAGALEEFTALAWVKIPSGGGGWSALDFDRSDYFTFTPGNDGSASGAGDVVGCHTTGSGGVTHDFGGNAVVRDGTWHLAACVYDGTDKIIYVDGAEDARASNPHSGSAIGTGDTRYGFIGDGSEATSYDGLRNDIHFEGTLGGVRFWERALTATEIQTIYQTYH
ncbi:hypothetical protein BRC19_00355 [Candidatus Saccharibacteria bacterium QS_5_54_17]|nr:MAG: hypothetical protein BRC19_00355 [Candidatus Saccharibacteria bacterium QS_5_54_17]